MYRIQGGLTLTSGRWKLSANNVITSKHSDSGPSLKGSGAGQVPVLLLTSLALEEVLMFTESPVLQREDDPQRVSWKQLVNSEVLSTHGFSVASAQFTNHSNSFDYVQRGNLGLDSSR